MSGVRRTGGHAAPAHPTPAQNKKPAGNARATQHTGHAGNAERPAAARRESASEQVAARRGMDAGIRRAGIEARLSASARVSSVPIIPAAQRHQTGNPLDRNLVTDRPAGDPDRYRAVNPALVSRQDGRYYFPAGVERGAHYFDKDGKTRGVVPRTNVKVDLAEANIRMIKDGDGIPHQHVHVKDLGYVRVSALVPPLKQLKAELKDGPAFKFPLRPGEQHELVDGFGKPRGTITEGEVKLNFGQVMYVGTEKYYYAFATRLDPNNRPTLAPGETPSTESIGASGWIKASALEVQPYAVGAQDARKVEAQPVAGKTDAYNITGGNPLETGPDGKYKFGYIDEKGDFESYKVLPELSLAKYRNVAAADYLRRSDGIVNLGFNAAGVSNDTFRVDGDQRLVFHASRNKDARVRIELFHPKDADHAGKKVVGHMDFVYGYVETPGGNKWGWMALDALTPK